MRILYDDVRVVGNSAWLPYKMVIFFEDGKCKELQIDHGDFEHRPAGTAFRMEFDQPEALINSADLVHYEPRRVWDLSQLPSVGSAEAHRITLPEPLEPPVMPGQREATVWHGLVSPAGCLLAVAVVVGGLYVYRRCAA